MKNTKVIEKMAVAVIGMAIFGCGSGQSSVYPKPEMSYVSEKILGHTFTNKNAPTSMREYYCSMGFDHTDLESAIRAGGYWSTDDQLVVFGDGGTPSILLERLQSDGLHFKLFVSRFDLDYVDCSSVRLESGRWMVVATNAIRSAYFYEQLRTIKTRGKHCFDEVGSE